MFVREVMRRDEDATELRSDILRKNALIADLTAMNQRKTNGHGEVEHTHAEQTHNFVSDGAVELELAQTKVRNYLFAYAKNN